MSKEEVSKLHEAKCKVMAKIERLNKGDYNKFADYNFTSTDDFKDAVRPLMAEHGLSVSITEVTHTLMKHESLKALHATIKYAITLHHEASEDATPDHLTVCLPFVGAQTSGIGRSYALKEWIKTTFLASSGDRNEEADLMDNSGKDRLSKAAAKSLHTELDEEINNMVMLKNLDVYRAWWEDEYFRISTLPKDWEISLRTKWVKEGQTMAANEKADGSSDEEQF